MIFRLSQKLNGKLKAGSVPTLPLDLNPFADWSAKLFLADRTQYVLLTNTTSLRTSASSRKNHTARMSTNRGSTINRSAGTRPS